MADDALITIPARAYGDRTFARMEARELWRHTWLLVGSTDHVATAGDFLEVRFGVAGTLLVRGDDGTLRGFENVCQHQGTPLCTGSGGGLDALTCSQHQWTWDLAGNLQAVDFGARVGPDENIPLPRLVVETWGPFVFANFDVGAPPLEAAIAPLAAGLADAGVDPDGLRCRSVVSVPTGGNWKSLVDGVTAVGPAPALDAFVAPGLGLRVRGATVTLLRARPYSGADRSVLDLLTFEPRDGGPEVGPRPLTLTLGEGEDPPAEAGADAELVAFARAQAGATTPTGDVVADASAAPDLAALAAVLGERLDLTPR